MNILLGTPWSPLALKDFQLSRTLVHSLLSDCLITLILPEVEGSFPSLPVPVSSPSFFRASANPVCFRALLKLNLKIRFMNKKHVG